MSAALTHTQARDTREAADMNPQTAAQLRSIVERIERLHEEKRALEEDIKEVYSEAAGNGFDKKIIREVVKRRGKDAAEVSEFESLVDLYMAAAGARP
jgi:uncharacterized protein (UPF0335 family)